MPKGVFKRKKSFRVNARLSALRSWTPERRKNMSNAIKICWKNPVYRKKILKIITNIRHSEKTKKLLSRLKLGTHPSIEARKCMSKGQIGRKHPLEVKEKMSQSQKKRIQQNPELRRKMVRNLKLRWKNSNYRIKILTSLHSSSSQNRPNKFEIKALDYLNSFYKNPFKYCGDGSILINGRSPDAIHKQLRIIALFNGVYWHLKKYNLKVNRLNKRKCERRESLPFIKAGYKVIFLWEDELNETERSNKWLLLRKKV